jgi:hypothetical protein
MGDVFVSARILISKSRCAEDPGLAPSGSDDGSCTRWSWGRAGKIDCCY